MGNQTRPRFFTRSRLARKLLLAIILLYTVAAVIFSLISFAYEYRIQNQRIQRSITDTMAMVDPLLSYQVWNYDEAGLNKTLESLMNNAYITGVSVTEEQGKQKFTFGNMSDKDRVLTSEPLRQDSPLRITYRISSTEFEQEIIFPLPDNHVSLGVLRVRSDHSVLINAMFSVFVRILFYVALQLMILVGALYWLMYRQVTQPISRLSEIIKDIQPGQRPSREKVREAVRIAEREDEISDLYLTYLAINESVYLKNKELMNYQDTLEQTVAERTRKLSEALRELENTSRYKSQFLANMSHEIRTPLNGILGMAELLQDTGLSGEQQQYLDTITSSGTLLTSVINDILDYSKVEAGKMVLEQIPFSLEQMADACITLFARQSQQKGVILRETISTTIPDCVTGDPTRLQQVIINLLSNAFKFTDSGHVALHIETDTIKQHLIIRVEDSGAGISVPAQQKLFSAFTQADTSTTRTHGGTGLGLAICKRIVELMNGRINVESTPGLGSVFSVMLPLTPGKPQAQPLTDYRQLNFGLISDNQEYLQAKLEQAGLKVSSFRDTADFISSAEDIHYLVIDQPAEETGDMSSELEQLKLQNPKLHITCLFRKPLAETERSICDGRQLTCLIHPVSTFRLKKHLRKHLSRTVAQISTQQNARELAGIKILVAEDNQVNQIVLKGLLKKIGMTADFAGNGEICLQMVMENRPDVILMDCEMPVMDGYHATSRIRETIRDGSNIVIIGLSAHAMQEHREKALQAGMNYYLTKPVNLSRLSDALLHLEQIRLGQYQPDFF